MCGWCKRGSVRRASESEKVKGQIVLKVAACREGKRNEMRREQDGEEETIDPKARCRGVLYNWCSGRGRCGWPFCSPHIASHLSTRDGEGMDATDEKELAYAPEPAIYWMD
jgi:hypothetical protein